ncbi:ATP-binding response regulator [Marinagarivorans algicola]|uniref:ATP-binding response regulator n=1 Tax=Marinagarivorans algicola TaxID=1513270 RepID=UPI0006B97E29|nr:ATP-binding protein [Marinagarivorans algicola]
MKNTSSVIHLRENHHVLIIDDSDTDISTLSYILSRGIDAEYIVSSIKNLDDAKKYFTQSNNIIDLIILDYHLIGHTAEDILKALEQSNRDVPVIVATSLPTKRKENQLLKYGIYDFWDKNSLSTRQLEHSIRFALNRHQLSKNNQRTQLLKGQSLASLIHDIKSPISTIVSYNKIAKNLIKDGKHAERIETCFDTIEKNCQLLQHLVEEVLSLSKSESESTHFEKKRVNILQSLNDSINNFLPKAQEHNLTIHKNFTINNVWLTANSDKLTQIFDNLISNAIKYTDEGTINISATVETQNNNKKIISIHFCDSGIGIAKNDLQKLFDPFNTINHKTIKVVDSHGLGLSIVKSLVEQHGGTIAVDSILGEGSDFCITFPIDDISQDAVTTLHNE